MSLSAALSASLVVLFDRLSSRDFINSFKGRKREERDFQKLKIMLLGVKPLLNDAELKQWTDPAVKDWVDELKDVIYHVDDLLDEIATIAMAMQSKLDSEFPTTTTTTTTTTLAVRHVSESKVEEMVERLEYFVNAKDSLGLREQVFVGQNIIPSHRLPTTSLVDHVSVYGRDYDKDKIIQQLISDYDSDGPPVSVIPIVGMGGIGKTTLTQLVYNDPRVDNHFEIKSWVCVSEEFDVLTLTKTILEGLTWQTCYTNDLNLLQVDLRKNLAGKRFLIVLDDVWNENKSKWDIFRAPFGVGYRGSKIIVTTRNEGVASIMRTAPIFHLTQLSHEDCWLLFSRQAFENVSHSVQSSLEPIGIKIVEKCKGLPLAAKTLGGLLRYKVGIDEWINVLESHFWDLPKDQSDILPALLLSYHYLPSHLKLCFAYCSIIPKDYAFEKDELVLLWIAEGFVQQPRTAGAIEEIGDGYFHDLISRSFFQHSSGNKFVMHDLINDLAQFIVGEYCFTLADEHRLDISKVRYFSYFKERFDTFAKLKVISESNCLRTFKPWSPHSIRSSYRLSKKVLHDVLPALRRLRVLSLSEYDIVELPDSIGNLIHLRHLDLSNTHIKCLPETICRLYNLENLLLWDCKHLTRLPAYLCKLISLRNLYITGTKLLEMPMHIGRLKSLQRLTEFIVGNQIGSAISELRELHYLRGTLSISNLQNVISVRDALEANLKNKKYLEDLKLEWGDGHTDDSQKAREILGKLQPHINLKHLTIKNYGGIRFPNWLGDGSFFHIKSLCLRSCTNCFELPPLGQLPSLQELTIARMNMVMKVGSEFYGYTASGIKSFQSLEKLTFEEMPEWEEWSILGAGEFCHLLELRISKCLKLIGEFPKYLPYLKKLEISTCQHLVIENILELDDHDEMDTDFPTVRTRHLSSLQVLIIENISALQSLPLELCRLTNLEKLSILDCPMLSSILTMGSDHRSHRSQLQPEEEMKRVNTALKTLSVINCQRFELLPEDKEHHFKFLQNLTISSSCDSLKSFPLGFFPELSSLEINKCTNFESLSTLDGFQVLTPLQSLQISSCPNMVSFVEEGLLAPNLTEITLYSCNKLKSLPEQMCSLLPSLHTLWMEFLPEIESFPSGGLPCSLSYLHIGYCDKLMARRMDWGLQRLPSLTQCDIHGECEGDEFLDSFPEEFLLPTSLTHLDIAYRPNLKSLNPDGLRHLNSLENLVISNCPKLQSLPDEGLPSSLLSLTIWDCPLLKLRCQRGKGEDWFKISHIPNIALDDEVQVE